MATYDRLGRSKQELRVPGGAVVWSYHWFGETYADIEGLYRATRRGLFAFNTKVYLLNVTVTDALLARPDASLVFLLAVLCTYDKADSGTSQPGDFDSGVFDID